MSEKIDDNELRKDLNYAIKSDLVKTLITNQDMGTSWLDPIHDSYNDMQEKDEKHHQVMNDYYKYNDWNNNSEYQRAMKLPLDKLDKYGLDGKDDSKELEAGQKRFDFEADHPILSKFF